MYEARAYTVTEDWVVLNPDVTHAEFRVYALIKGNIPHGNGGIPNYGFRTTAAWVCKMSNGLISVSAAHRSLQGLAKKGILNRLNDPNRGGEGAEFEFVTRPENYDGPRSVMGEAGEVKKLETRSLAFTQVKLKGGPELPGKSASRRSVSELKMDDPAPDGESESESESEFDTPGPDSVPMMSIDLTENQREFATVLEALTGQQTDVRLRLMAGACRRIAEAVRPALGRGWEPEVLARRLAAELNSKIHSPEKLLLGKAKDLGDPPPKRRTSTLEPPPDRGQRVTIDQADGEDLARVEAARARYQQNLLARRMAGGHRKP
jgi:hypothetical protein